MYIKDKLNPHLYKLYNGLDEHGEVFEFSSNNLIWDKRRFDLAVKYVYLTQKNSHPTLKWHKKIYFEHIKAFSRGQFKEEDGSKTNFDDFLKSYHKLEEAFRTNIFDTSLSVVPFKNGINTDGSHRISLSAFYSHPLKGVSLPQLIEPNYNYVFFRHNKQPNWLNDFVFLQNVLSNEDIRIIHVHPKARIKHDEILDVLLKHGIIPEYHKSIYLSKFAHGLAVRELYKSEKWIGDHKNKFAGAFVHASQSYTAKKPLKVYFIKESNTDLLRKIKNEIREICNIGNFSVHINDTYKETLNLARIFLNEESILFLNSCFNNKTFWETDEFIAHLKHKSHPKNFPEYVLTGSFPLSLIGLRKNNDMDFVCDEQDISIIKSIFKDADCHNEYIQQFGLDHNDIIYNPVQSFFWQGIKFISLKNVWHLKKQRQEHKDYIDKYLFWCQRHIPLDTNATYQKLHRLTLNPKIITRKLLGNNVYEILKKVIKK